MDNIVNSNAPTTLADSLLEDLDDLSDLEETCEDNSNGDGDGNGVRNEGAVGSMSALVSVDGGEGTDLDYDDNRTDGGGANAMMDIDVSRDDRFSNEGASNDDHNDNKSNRISNKKKGRKRLLDDPKLKSHLVTVRSLLKRGDDGETINTIKGSNNSTTADGRRHRLITESTRRLSSLRSELTRANVDLAGCYGPRFPELHELLPDPVPYLGAVRALRYGAVDPSSAVDGVGDAALSSVPGLTPDRVITLGVAGSASSGRPLTEIEIKAVEAAALYVGEVVQAVTDLDAFVADGATAIVPNSSSLVGPGIAAAMLGAAGGLPELSSIPACNLHALGRNRKGSGSRGGGITTGAAAVGGAGDNGAGGVGGAVGAGDGILSGCDLLRRIPLLHRRRATRVVAAKLALCIRCDLSASSASSYSARNGKDGTGIVNDASGRKFRKEVEEKFRKWEEPDKAPVVKALPKPDLTTKKRRGGKRMRRLKERFEETELMKQANRRGFSIETGEYGDDSMGLTLGMLESKGGAAGTGSGNLRTRVGFAAAGSSSKMRHANTKASRKRDAQMAATGGGGYGNTSGLASSMAFTPVQGLELVNPDAGEERARQANLKWFGEDAGFQSALPNSSDRSK